MKQPKGGEMHFHRRIAASLVAAALIAPAAAQAYPDEGVLYLGSSAAQAPTSQSPDDRGFSRAPALEAEAQAEALNETEAIYRASAAPRYNTQTGVSPTPVQVVVHDDGGFAWAHAAEGAAVGFGFAAILAALALLIVRSRRVVSAA
jgi:hypothetical protein